MAFLCEDCIHPDYKSEFMYRPLSRGPCEKCKYTDSCVDTKAPIDPNWRKNVEKTLQRFKEKYPNG